MTELTISRSLKSLEDHREMLNTVFTTAQERILIVSPFISRSAIESDNIASLVSEAVGRGVQVQVFVDSQLNCFTDGTMKDRAMDGIAELVEAGAQVGVVNGIHKKTLARDNDLITQGSFNWLSAVRIRNGECPMKEHSQIYTGEVVSTMIIQELAKIADAGYGLVSILESDGIEVTRAGKIFGLGFILVIPPMIGTDLGNRNVGLAITALMFGVLAMFYWLKVNKSRNVASA